MGKTKEAIIQKAANTTVNIGSGLLRPEQSKRFLRQAMEGTPLTKVVRHEMRRARSGEINKIGIGSRVIRKKTENTDDGHRVAAVTSTVPYQTVAVRLPFEISEDVLRENIEGQGLEKTLTDLMTAQLGIDLEDLGLNGDTSVPSSAVDHDFLAINDGWIKKLRGGANVLDWGSVNGGKIGLNMFYNAKRMIASKYQNGKHVWLMSPNMYSYWEQFYLTQAVMKGGVVTDKRVESPAGIPVLVVPKMPDDVIVLTDPKNLIMVHTYEVRIRKTTEGVDAIMKDMRYYVTHLDIDTIIEEMDAAAVITGIAPYEPDDDDDITPIDTTLASLSIGSLTLTPTFAPTTYAYTAATTNATNRISVTTTDPGAGAAITVNGASVNNESNVSWNEGSNTVKITVSAVGSTDTVYEVEVTKS